MTFRPAFPEAAVEYIRIHQDESRSVLAYRVTVLFGYSCTKEGVKGVIKRIRKEVPHAMRQEAKATQTA